jgi:hypothetical protein
MLIFKKVTDSSHRPVGLEYSGSLFPKNNLLTADLAEEAFSRELD